MTETQWNKEIVRDYFRCMRDGDQERLLAYAHPSVVVEVPGTVAGGRYDGVVGFRTYLERIRGLIGDTPVTQAHALLADGAMVMAETTVKGQVSEGEALDPLRVLWLFELRDRKIVREALFFDTEEVARRLGETAREPAAA